MKKVLFLVAIISIANYMLADAITNATLSVTSNAGGVDQITFFESDEFSADFDDDYDATKMMNDGLTSTINLYVSNVNCSWGNASMFATNDLDGTILTFQANSIENDPYTITFVASSLVNYQLKDLKTGTLTDIVKDGTYSFTQTKNTTEERFEIVKKPAEPAICHQYGNLIITGHQGAKVKVLDMADQVAIAEQTLATDDEVISLSTLTKGAMYQVVVDDGEPMLIRIQ